MEINNYDLEIKLYISVSITHSILINLMSNFPQHHVITTHVNMEEHVPIQAVLDDVTVDKATVEIVVKEVCRENKYITIPNFENKIVCYF